MAQFIIAGPLAAFDELRTCISPARGIVNTLNGQALCRRRPLANGNPVTLVSDPSLLGRMLRLTNCPWQKGEPLQVRPSECPTWRNRSVLTLLCEVTLTGLSLP